tara:strand:+ start:2568 stop:2915 length:348 start_codon:yes stop_codon:yes gene_type:complete
MSRIIKRRVTAPSREERETCKFRAMGCTVEATTHNKWDVPMCDRCHTIWQQLRDENTIQYTNGRRFMIPVDLMGKEMAKHIRAGKTVPKMKLREPLPLPKEEGDEPIDEFYCGEY